MTDPILTTHELIADLEARLPILQRDADAEAAYTAAHSEGGPWAGATTRLDDVQTELRDLRLQMRAELLKANLDELATIEAAIASAASERTRLEGQVRSMREHAAVRRFEVECPERALRNGWGYSWDLLKPWIVSQKPRTFLPQFAVSLDRIQQFHFDDNERAVIAQYFQTKTALINAINQLNAASDRKARLLQQHPELSQAAKWSS